MSDQMIAALQQQVVGLKLALKQANQITAKLMGQRLTDEQRQELFRLVLEHCMEQDASKAAQLTGVMRTALLELNGVAQTTADQGAKQRLIEVIKALTLTIGYAAPEVHSAKVEHGNRKAPEQGSGARSTDEQ